MSGKLSVVCVSGTLEKLQMAAMVASVAAAMGTEVRVFLSMNALEFFIKGHDLKPASEGRIGDQLRRPGVPEFKQLFMQAVELGDAQLLPCSMAMDILQLKQEQLEQGLGAPTGLTKFLGDAEGGPILTF
ncbi:MAG: DsrE/DsrF/DrsH-like family protein [Burkholderiales bacterium]|nr:DsrE/DsrF/DrsH-like family protein [Burkholderiales bacterium]